MPKIRVLVVDDAVVIRRMVSEVLTRDPNFEVVGIAANGSIALKKITQVNPDAITLDVEMPEMNGLETVREIRKTHKTLPIVMFSALTEKGASATFDALEAGASDYVTKPAKITNMVEAMDQLQADLIPKLKQHCRHLLPSAQTVARPTISRTVKRSTAPAVPPKALCIGTSTGGPNALADVFQDFHSKFSIPTFIVQHMPPVFTKLLADRINTLSPNTCYEATDGQLIEPGSVYLAPGGKHMEIKSDGVNLKISLNENPPENSCRPAVDVLFRSVAQHYGAATLGVILTGMGKDGQNGSASIVEAGGRILAQDEESSVVWGMPGAVAEANLADKILPLPQIAAEITKRI